MVGRPITQYDEDMNVIAKYNSQEDAVAVTGISGHRMRKSRKNNKPVEGYYFLFNEDHPCDKIRTKCDNCGKEFLCQRFRIEKHQHIFCGKKCEGEYRRRQSEENCVCEYCGKIFHRKQSHIDKNTHNYCSTECKSRAESILMCGEGNHQYGLKGDKNSSWKSDERISYYGYKLIRCLDHPFKNSDDMVFEHRLIAEKYLLTEENSTIINGKKYLSQEYCVHHIDFDKLNNDPENLYIIKRGLHTRFHILLNEEIKKLTDGKIQKVEKGTYSEIELRNKFFNFINVNQLVAS